MIPKAYLRTIIKKRPQRIHKKKLGQVLIIAGSERMPGAGLLVSHAALRTGVGLLTMAYPESLRKDYVKNIFDALHLSLPQTPGGELASKSFSEINSVAKKQDTIAIGPGLGIRSQTRSLVLRLIININKALVLDASALQAVADSSKIKAILHLKKSMTILTPHEGEMAKLIKHSVSAVRNSRKQIAEKYSRSWRCYIVLKGYKTIIASPNGKIITDNLGGPELATAGSGDVLTGIISTLVAQNLSKPLEAISTAVYVHSRAGQLAKKSFGTKSVIASDLIKKIPMILNSA